MRRPLLLILSVAIVAGCDATLDGVVAYTGATIIDVVGGRPMEGAVLLVRGGRVMGVGSPEDVTVPSGAERVDLSGTYVIPGLINAHGHVGGIRGLQSGFYTEENLLRQLSLYARYGVTAVASLGGDGEEAVALRSREDSSDMSRARLMLAGAVVTGDTPAEAIAVVDENVALGADLIKIRVDDNLGTTEKMNQVVYQAVIDYAHGAGVRVAAHLFYLDDAKSLLRGGVDLVVHSIRDAPVGDDVIALFRERGVCYVPTLTREVSTFVYESEPQFFSDPFFLAEVSDSILAELRNPALQDSVRASASAQRYKQALEIASSNLRPLQEGGVTLAMGTDTGPRARFQGFFEHLELELMQDAGLSPAVILLAATRNAAECLGRDDLGTLEVGKRADFVVLSANPLDDIRNTRSIVGVWIGGNEVPGRPTS